MLKTTALIVLLSATLAAQAEKLPKCSTLGVDYADPRDPPLEQQAIVRRLATRPASVAKEGDRAYKPLSPQETAAFNRVAVIDRTKPGPRSNSIEVFRLRGEAAAWQIDLPELHDNASLEWLNEELLFIRAWRGRIVSLDLIFHLGTGKFVYAQEANHGRLTAPCAKR